MRSWPRSSEALTVAGASLLFAAALSWPVLSRPADFGLFLDWDQHWLYHWVPYHSAVAYRQVPLWNPYECGGMPMLGNPQSRLATPFFLLHLLLGPFVALHLELWLHAAIAAAGGYALGRAAGASRAGAAACAAVCAGSSTLYLHYAVGHSWALSFAYLPAIAAYFLRALDTHRAAPAAAAGLLLGLVAGEGGIYPAPYAALLLLLLAVGAAAARRQLWPLAALGIAAAFGAASGAVKLLPTWELMRHNLRLHPSTEAMSPGALAAALFSPDQDALRALAGVDWGFHEYGAYVGVFAVALAAAGLALEPRRAVRWAALGAVFAALALGDWTRALGLPLRGSAGPWPLLHHLPPFTSMHVPSRFLVLVSLSIGVLAALGAGALQKRLGRDGTAAALFLVAATAIDLARVSPASLRHAYDDALEPRAPSATFRQVLDSSHAMLAVAQSNQGALRCYEQPLPIAAVAFGQPGYRGEQWAEGPAQVRLARWSPNAVALDVHAEGPALVVVNQNFHEGFRIDEGRGEIVSYRGLLAARVPAGAQHLVLGFHSPGFSAGLALCSLSIAAALWLWRRGR